MEDSKDLFLIPTDCPTDKKYYITKKGLIYDSFRRNLKFVKLKGVAPFRRQVPLPELLAAAFIGYKIGESFYDMQVGFKDENFNNLSPDNLKIYYSPDSNMIPCHKYPGFQYTKYPFCEFKLINKELKWFLVDYSTGERIVLNDNHKDPEFHRLKSAMIKERDLKIKKLEEQEAIKKSKPIKTDVTRELIVAAKREAGRLKVIQLIDKFKFTKEELF